MKSPRPVSYRVLTSVCRKLGVYRLTFIVGRRLATQKELRVLHHVFLLNRIDVKPITFTDDWEFAEAYIQAWLDLNSTKRGK